MALGDSALSAFSAASGMNVGELSHYIRALFVVMILVWAAWAISGLMNSMGYTRTEAEYEKNIEKIILILMVIVISIGLAYVP